METLDQPARADAEDVENGWSRGAKCVCCYIKRAQHNSLCALSGPEPMREVLSIAYSFFIGINL